MPTEQELILGANDPEDAEPDLTQTLNRVLAILRRRRWSILIAVAAGVLATTALLSRMPSRYTSEGTLVVVQQQVSARFVPPTGAIGGLESFQAMVREILSHRQLLQIANEFALYAKERERLRPETIVDAMRRNITTEPLDAGRDEVSSFKIAFTAENPRLAYDVTARLAALFIEQNQKAQTKVATSTSAFLTQQLEAKRQELAEQAQRIRDFKLQHGSDLPDNQQGTVATLIDLRAQLQSTTTSLNRARQQQLLLENLLRRSLARMQSDREILLARFTPKHPQVLKKDQDIAAVEALIRRLRLGSAEPKEVTPALDDPSLAQTIAQAETNALEIESLSKDEERLKSALAQYEGRLSRMPEKEQQLAAMQREYDLLAQDYTDLKGKLQQSELSADVARQQEGQQFRLVDPPTLPVAPSSPKRLRISLGGLAGGVLLGFAFAFMRERMDNSFRDEREIAKTFPAPIIIGIPALLTPSDRRRSRRTKTIEYVSAALLLVVITAAELYGYLRQ